MPAIQPQPIITTLEEYETLPEDTRAEVFDGVIYNMSSPSEIHQTISTELTAILNTYIRSKKDSCRVFHVQYSFDSTIKVNIYEDLYINFADIAEILNI